jgi:hypothetical protein
MTKYLTRVQKQQKNMYKSDNRDYTVAYGQRLKHSNGYYHRVFLSEGY